MLVPLALACQIVLALRDDTAVYADGINALLLDGSMGSLLLPNHASLKWPESPFDIQPELVASNFHILSSPPSTQSSNCYYLRLSQSIKASEQTKLVDLLASVHGVVKRRHSSIQKAFTVCFPQDRFPLSLVSRLRHVVYVERDHGIALQQTQTKAPWGLWRIGNASKRPGNGYSFFRTGKNVTVYVLDSGVHTDHPEIAGRATVGRSFVRTPGEDCAGHGTQVASIIAGTNVGVAKRAKIVGLKILDCNGEGTNSGLVSALHWVIKNHQKPAVINLSVGGPPSLMIDEAVSLVLREDISVVVAAGNSKSDACNQSPSNAYQALTVAASNEADERARFSNFGKCVDLFAPGVGILCAIGRDKDPSGYCFSSGTSMAAPFVSGVIAQILEENPSYSVEKIRSKLFSICSKGVLNPLSLFDSPNLLVQSLPGSDSSLQGDDVDLADPDALPWRPSEGDVPIAAEIAVISVASLIVAGVIGTAILSFKFN